MSTPPEFSTFRPVTEEEVEKFISDSPDKHCDLDPIPTWLLKKCSSVLIPAITKMINFSLSTGRFPSSFKESIVCPLLKKPNLDKEILSNYRPISNLSFLSKLTERVVKSRLLDHLTQHSLLNPFQSAYTKFHSTETVLLSLYDHLTNAIGLRQVSCLCLLDLSAAFDTIDHSILLQRLSDWFGIDGLVLKWFRSYLASRSFRVHCSSFFSSPHSSTVGFPQGSVLGPILFILYTTPLSSLISSLSLNHHLYADDTQLFISFMPNMFNHASSIIHNALEQISAWMSANLLTLNPSKTEFLLIGLKQQLSKISSPSLTLNSTTTILPSPSARNLGMIFDQHLSFSDQISSLSRICFSHIRDLRRIRPVLDHKTAITIATSIVHSKLDYCNSLYYNLPAGQLQRLQHIQNALARAVFRAPKFCHVTPMLKSLHWLKINERIQYKTISIIYKTLNSSQPSYLHQLLTVQPPRSTRSSCYVTLLRPSCTSSLAATDRSFRNVAPRIWNKLPPFLRQYSSTASSDHSLPKPTPVFSLNPSRFLSSLKTYLFLKSFPP